MSDAIVATSDLIRLMDRAMTAEAELAALRAENVEKDRQLKIATLKANASLANNLCPDHRDKQYGKPCLACIIEHAERQIAELRAENVELRLCYQDLLYCVGNKYPGETRHETAKRYLLDREKFSLGAQIDAALEGTKEKA